MLTKVAAAFLLLAVTVTIHAAGLTFVLQRVSSDKALDNPRFGPRMWLLIRLASWVISIHLVEIAAWALFFFWQKCVPDLETYFYFAVVTYTTVGYGDIVLPEGWRLFAGVEALTGILMCGWSTAFFFAIVNRMEMLLSPGGSMAQRRTPAPRDPTDSSK